MDKKSDKNLILIGMMGAGKTTVGRVLAHFLHMPFVDVDEIYKEKFGEIVDTFAMEGEAVFRERESTIIAALSNISGTVIATGGGAVLSNEFGRLKNSGSVIWLKASADILFERIKQDNKRPLSKGKQSLRDILFVREQLYKKYADFIVECDRMPLDKVSDAIISFFTKID